MADVKEMTIPSSRDLRAQRKHFETVHCLLLPLNGELALLPNAAVAEVISYAEPEPVSSAPDWLLGRLSWRERRIPLVAFEMASDGQSGKLHKGTRIAVLNTLNGNANMPYIAMQVQGLPSLQIVRPNAIQFTDRPTMNRQSIKAYVNLNGTAAIVPDIDDLESRLLRLSQH